jgi:pimeloyl-ACP methyl ester carboxylesterase
MPHLQLPGVRLWYEDSGGPGPAVVFAHGLLWSGRMWDAQVAALSGRYRCIRFDFRGQGQSEVTASGYDMDTLAEDAAALLENLECTSCHFVGLSMGGFIGMRLAARRPQLLRSLVLMETAADAEPAANVPRYRLLGMVARLLGRTGFRLVAGKVMRIMFGRKFLEDPARVAERALWRERLMANDRVGATRALRGVIERRAILPELSRISLPTLVLVGDQDLATVPARAMQIRDAIAGSRLVVIPGAGHSASVEEPDFVNARLMEFLEEVEGR